MVPIFFDRCHFLIWIRFAYYCKKIYSSIIKISRGTVSTTLKSICRKFGMVGQSMIELNLKAGQMGLPNHIPDSLIKSKAVRLDN